MAASSAASSAESPESTLAIIFAVAWAGSARITES